MVQEQLAVARGYMGIVRSQIIGCNLDSLGIQFSLLKKAPGIRQANLPLPDRFYFGPGKDNAGNVFIKDLKFPENLLVRNLYLVSCLFHNAGKSTIFIPDGNRN